MTQIQLATGAPKTIAAWLQWTGSVEYVGDVSTTDVEQHVDALPNEVLLLDFEVAAYLLAHDTRWVVMSVYPNIIPPVHDSVTGLDMMFVTTAATWGVTPGGQPYFDSEGAQAAGAYHLLVISGIPYLSR